MMKTAIVNIKTIVTGDWRKPFAKGDCILMDKGKIRKIGTLSKSELKSCDVVVDANKTTPEIAKMTCMPFWLRQVCSVAGMNLSSSHKSQQPLFLSYREAAHR